MRSGPVPYPRNGGSLPPVSPQEAAARNEAENMLRDDEDDKG